MVQAINISNYLLFVSFKPYLIAHITIVFFLKNYYYRVGNWAMKCKMVDLLLTACSLSPPNSSFRPAAECHCAPWGRDVTAQSAPAVLIMAPEEHPGQDAVCQGHSSHSLGNADNSCFRPPCPPSPGSFSAVEGVRNTGPVFLTTLFGKWT